MVDEAPAIVLLLIQADLASAACMGRGTVVIGKDRDPLRRDPQLISLSSLIKAISSLTDSHISLSSLTKAIFQRVSKWGSLSFPMTV